MSTKVAPEEKPELDIVVKDNVAYIYYEDPLCCGYIKAPSRSSTPWWAWTGPKIPMKIWKEILAFFAWSYDTTKSETQVRLYYHPKKQEWKAHAFPQEKGTNMTTHELPELMDEECKKAGLIGGWVVAGTVHHHCSSGAFQSGVDQNNEKTQQGLHITVGHMDKTIHDLHGRTVFKGQQYPIDTKEDIGWAEWFEKPDGLDALPRQFEDAVVKTFLAKCATKEDTFPDTWKNNLITLVKKQEDWKTGQQRNGSRGAHNNYGVNDSPKSRDDSAAGTELWTGEDANLANACIQFDELCDEHKIAVSDLLCMMDTQVNPKPAKDEVALVKKGYEILQTCGNLTLEAIETAFYYNGVG